MISFWLGFVWILGTIYASIPSFWLGVHPFAHYWRTRGTAAYGAILLLWAAIIVTLLGATAPWRHARLYANSLAWLPAFCVLVFSISIYWRARKYFGVSRLVGRPEFEPGRHEQKLITAGIHAQVRHPIYLAHLCTLTALTMGSGLIVLCGLLGFAMLTGWWMIHYEDRELETRFGDEYRSYKKRVPAVLPGF